MQGLDAVGLATMEAAAARVPFSASFFPSLMTQEDITNLRTFQRLMLLLSGIRRKEDSNTVRFVVYPKELNLCIVIALYHCGFCFFRGT